MAKVTIDVLRVFQDARGLLFEPMGAEFGEYHNVHVVLSAPGVVRGNHFHPRGTEVSSVSGPTLVRYREDGQLRDVHVPAGQVWRFTFPPGVAHAVRNEGDTPTVLAAFNTEVHDPDNADAVRDVLFES